MSYKITLDIETFGTNPGCIVREVGIVSFNDNQIIDSYQFFLNTSDQAELGLTIDVKTLDWLFTNNTYFLPNSTNCAKLQSAYPDCNISHPPTSSLALMLSIISGADEIWTNGNFDLPVLSHCLKTLGQDLDYKYYKVRDFRTLKHFLNFKGSSIPDLPFAHTGIGDAMWQTEVLLSMYEARSL